MTRTLRLPVLLCALAAACSQEQPSSADSDAPSEARAQAERQPTASTTSGESPPINETAQQYLDRTRAGARPRPGDTDPDAVGAIVQCAVCHGANGGGNEALDAPRIGGLPAWYLARQLKYFKAGLRGGTDEDTYGTQMRAIALPLHDQAIEDLAAYLAQMNPPPAAAMQEGDVARGRQIYAVCAACHGMDGKGNPALNTPSLVEQSGTYLVRQLENFRTGLRGSHPADAFGQQMRPIVATSLQSRQDAVDVTAYVASLREGSATPEARSGDEDASR